MALRTVVLVDERDRRLGTAVVPETTAVIKHKDSLFIRTDKGLRLTGGGIAVAFIETEPVIRNKLEGGINRG